MAPNNHFNPYRTRTAKLSVQDLRMKAKASATAASKSGAKYEPVAPHARTKSLCSTWWGSAWCENLERYPDFTLPMSSGRKYVLSGAVLDLKIKNGQVLAKVQGSSSYPYEVEIQVAPLSGERARDILEKCSSRVENLDKLVAGEFPQDLKQFFSARGGLFPTPKDLYFTCGCDSFDKVCPHVAAVLSGIGLRLDENPFYFFYLRGLDVDSFIDSALVTRVENMLAHTDVVTERTIEQDVSHIFGLI